MDALLEQMTVAERLAENQSSFINVLTYGEAIAGIWEKAPDDDKAVADTNGLYLNCVNSGLYMVCHHLTHLTCTILTSTENTHSRSYSLGHVILLYPISFQEHSSCP